MRGFIESFSIPFRMVFIMWAVFYIDSIYAFEFALFGLYPREMFGLIGVFTMPFIHGSLPHLVSNTFPLLFLGVTLFYFFDRIAIRVFFECYIATGLLIWLFARQSIHIGASGIIYAIAAFLIFFGLFRKDIKSLIISVIIILLYGSLVYGIFPNQPGVSWESHLFGGLIGTVVAYHHRAIKKVSS
jgi:membrane associated rhomboid family serine protease